ncbi:MAG: hypothetical protein JWN84_628 [Nocardioides sp.]|nr:hypothetical protein [Nocardioides sp.]
MTHPDRPDHPEQHEVHARRDLLTSTQLAERWGVSTGHLANLRHHGEGINYLKIGSRVAYRYADVIAYENEHYVQVS